VEKTADKNVQLKKFTKKLSKKIKKYDKSFILSGEINTDDYDRNDGIFVKYVDLVC
jgi:hypothetical protein